MYKCDMKWAGLYVSACVLAFSFICLASVFQIVSHSVAIN